MSMNKKNLKQRVQIALNGFIQSVAGMFILLLTVWAICEFWNNDLSHPAAFAISFLDDGLLGGTWIFAKPPTFDRDGMAILLTWPTYYATGIECYVLLALGAVRIAEYLSRFTEIKKSYE